MAATSASAIHASPSARNRAGSSESNYSGGSIVALDLAVERPDLVASLVLLDPAFDLKRCLTPGLVRALAGAQLLRRLRGERRGAEHWMRYVASYSTYPTSTAGAA